MHDRKANVTFGRVTDRLGEAAGYAFLERYRMLGYEACTQLKADRSWHCVFVLAAIRVGTTKWTLDHDCLRHDR